MLPYPCSFAMRIPLYLAVIHGNDQRRDEIGDDSGTGAYKDGPDQSDDGGVNIKVFPQTAAYAAQHFVVIGTV